MNGVASELEPEWMILTWPRPMHFEHTAVDDHPGLSGSRYQAVGELSALLTPCIMRVELGGHMCDPSIVCQLRLETKLLPSCAILSESTRGLPCWEAIGRAAGHDTGACRRGRSAHRSLQGKLGEVVWVTAAGHSLVPGTVCGAAAGSA